MGNFSSFPGMVLLTVYFDILVMCMDAKAKHSEVSRRVLCRPAFLFASYLVCCVSLA